MRTRARQRQCARVTRGDRFFDGLESYRMASRRREGRRGLCVHCVQGRFHRLPRGVVRKEVGAQGRQAHSGKHGPGGVLSPRLMPSGPMVNWRMAGSWLLALVLAMARDRLIAPWSR